MDNCDRSYSGPTDFRSNLLSWVDFPEVTDLLCYIAFLFGLIQYFVNTSIFNVFMRSRFLLWTMSFLYVMYCYCRVLSVNIFAIYQNYYGRCAALVALILTAKRSRRFWFYVECDVVIFSCFRNYRQAFYETFGCAEFR